MSARVRVQHLDGELRIALDAFNVAKKRYFGMKGDLVDVRDSLKNLERVEENLNFARIEFAQYSAYQAVLNGAR